MRSKSSIFSFLLIVCLIINVLISPFTSTFPVKAAGVSEILADFETGIPAGFVPFADSWDGSGSSTTLAMNTTSAVLPTVPVESGNTVLSVTYNIAASGSWGGGPGYGGVTQDFASIQDWSSSMAFSFWFYGSNSGADLRVELKSDGADAANSNRYEYTFTDDEAGWRFFNLPWSVFTRRYDYNPGPSPDDPINLSKMRGYSILLPAGASGSFYLDQVALFGVSTGSEPEPGAIIDDFENGVNPGTPCVGIPLGFCTFAGASSVTIAAVTTPPAPTLPELGNPNTVIQVNLNVTDYAGFIHGFTNLAGDTWTPQDWSAFGGFGFWIYGEGSGTMMFIDLLENRNPGSDSDDAERWTVTFTDDFIGWQKLEFPFTNFVRKDVGNGAPNDGFTGDEVYGWAFGTLGTGGARTYYLDQAYVFGQAAERPLEVRFSANKFEVAEGASAVVTVKLTRPLKDGDPDQVSVSYIAEPGSAIPDRDYTPASGTLTFIKGDVSEQTFSVSTIDNNKHDGNKTIILHIYDAVDVPLGSPFLSRIDILDDEPLDSTLLDDFERGASLWNGKNVTLSTPEILAVDPMTLPGQGTYENILEVNTALLVDLIINGSICKNGNGVLTVALLSTDTFDALSVDHATVQFGSAFETHRNKKTGVVQRHVEDFEGDGDLDLIFHFRVADTGYDCASTQFTLTGQTFTGKPIVAGGAASFGHDFAIGQDWTRAEAMSFWFYGTNSGDTITLQVKDNRAPDPGPSGWNMVWSDEFNDPAGTPPNPAYWSYEIGDGTANSNPGWGNSELQYYTNSTDNSATDGGGNLVITAREADDSLTCYYGPCEYTSARLISQYKAEFAYGRIESRLQVPSGEDGLWPAFWSLGTDIGEVGWPQTGEIDFMEYVSRLPNEVFGTIHGPGYSGGASFGDLYTFGRPVSNDYHTFAIEWEPNLINWYVDGILYHTAVPADVAPNEWVFNDPVFLIYNMAIGGNFGGPVSDDLTFPQELKIDYVRVYQGPDTAERWEATFADNLSGWQQVVIPFASLTRSANQPDGAPDDGLTLSEVWGYGFELPEGGTTSGTMRLDQVRLQLIPPPTEITVTNLNDSGDGSLRQALEEIAIGGTITFDPGLANGMIHTTGPLVLSQDVTIDSSTAPGITLNGGGTDRLLIVDPGTNAIVNGLTFTNGYGYQLAGCVLNNGTLTLDHITVTGCLMTTDAGDFWQGGGGIYSGDGATLNLIDSTVSNNISGHTGGGVYSFFNTTTNVIRSTVSGNVALDVAGGFRTLGEVYVENSTISGNTSTTWHGGAVFITDGVATITNSTITGNTAPGGTTGGLFVGTFTTASATLNLQNTIVANNGDFGCFLAPFGAGAVALNSLGNNVFTDGTCFPVASDQIVADAGLGLLADNGGPTLTHALLAGSLAIDAANTAVCPATDQRGIARPQGAHCDIGSYEAP